METSIKHLDEIQVHEKIQVQTLKEFFSSISNLALSLISVTMYT